MGDASILFISCCLHPPSILILCFLLFDDFELIYLSIYRLDALSFTSSWPRQNDPQVPGSLLNNTTSPLCYATHLHDSLSLSLGIHSSFLITPSPILFYSISMVSKHNHMIYNKVTKSIHISSQDLQNATVCPNYFVYEIQMCD